MNRKNSFIGVQVRSVDEANMVVEHIVNTKALDRYYTCVLPKGARVENYLKNPVVLWCHNIDETTIKVPIAKCIELQIEEDSIKVKTQFNANDPLAVKVFQAYKDGFLNAWSIGFQPENWEGVTEKNLVEVNQRFGLNLTKENIGSAGIYGLYVIYQWELLEYSAVPVPGNPEALSKEYTAELVTRGLADEKDIRTMLTKKEEKAEEVSKEVITKETVAEETKEVVAVETVSKEVAAEVIKESVEEKKEEKVEEPVVVVEPEVKISKEDLEALEVRINSTITELKAFVYTALAEDLKLLKGKVEALEGSKDSEELKKGLGEVKIAITKINESLSLNNLDDIRRIKTNAKKSEDTGFFVQFLQEKLK